MPLPPGVILGPAIEEVKITDYHLDVIHEEGRPEAKFFLSRGFTLDDPKLFISALLEHGHLDNVVKTTRNEFGTRFVCQGRLSTPDGFRVAVEDR